MVAAVHEFYSSAVFLISCRYQFLKAQELEVHLKILDEVRLRRIIAIAVDYFILEVFFIMA